MANRKRSKKKPVAKKKTARKAAKVSNVEREAAREAAKVKSLHESIEQAVLSNQARFDKRCFVDPAKGSDLLTTAQMVSVLNDTILNRGGASLLNAEQRAYVRTVVKLREAICKRLLVVGLPTEWEPAVEQRCYIPKVAGSSPALGTR